jgi:DNA repair protein RadD
MRGGEFVAEEVEQLMDRDALVEAACQEIIDYTRDRKSCLIFASGIKHGRHVTRVLRNKHGVKCGFVCGETPPVERDEILARFRNVRSERLFDREPLKYLVNVNVLTTGFDAPNIDCVVLLRPTASPVLYTQAVGRGFRLHPGKQNCLVLDFGGNILRHGPVDQIKITEKTRNGSGEPPAKECPECQSVVAAAYSICPDCGYEFPPPERQNHDATASNASILSGEVTDEEYDVRDVAYHVHTKRDAPEDAPKTMRVDYRLGLSHWESEWVCFEHSGFARRKAEQWWRRRSPDPVPDTVERAVEIAGSGGLCTTEKITVRTVSGEKYPSIVDHVLGPMPEPVTVMGYDPEEIPF